ncbi:hypothetical protein AN639_10015 [Candidatus Epulonipiscium fishelsonii]|uniref:Uncharacterized protein n=1 Tax=Candidatus Epulonipiscium fishelsonii TaxID=77094 RepID=A0ACC8XA24_9FIRM|nr:hypothetical protein AN396_09585 [Epulopiscium sp. SCG-B11WGA-EpuloA1]ONI43772.1 hypothetical protein AN639_10015 [Epulopiscium sp. SCG-B05WGA-EpuloA1]
MNRLLKKSLFIIFVLSSSSSVIVYGSDNSFDVEEIMDNGKQLINSISTSIKSLVFDKEESMAEPTSDSYNLTEYIDEKVNTSSLELYKPLTNKEESTTTATLNVDKIETDTELIEDTDMGISELIQTSIDSGVDISELMQDENTAEKSIYQLSNTESAVYGDDLPEKFYIGKVVNSGNGDGYSEQNIIDYKDFHYGWELGHFYISDFTDNIEDESGNPIFLKTAGNSIALNFQLEQNINKLNELDSLTIQKDEKGYHTNFGVIQSNLGRGTLMIKYTDHQNKSHDPIIYTDYLSAIGTNANTKIELFEEGDYEVSFNYRIKNDSRIIFGVSILPTYNDYSINFKFSIRNGNCMVFPYDIVTENELINKSFTENGFYLDLANSHYLDVWIKKGVVARIDGTIVEDVRFDRPVKENEEFVDEGIYTITISNPYTGQTNTKQIYVEPDNLLKAHANKIE